MWGVALVSLSALASGCTNSSESPPAVTADPAETSQHAAPVPSDPPRLFPPGLRPDAYPDLHNLLKITDTIYSGAEPHTEAAFAQLQQLGVTTVVSVDGAKPDSELAAKYGLRYVHLPFGYDGIPAEVRAGLTRVMRESTQPVYIHCHHGKHRGPAAVAIACIASGTATGPEALEILKVAGTGENYRGLWRDVEQFTPLGPDVELPELVSVATVDSLVSAMAQIGRANDHLKILSTHMWQTPADHPDLVPVTEALVLAEGFREGVRLLDAERSTEFVDWLKESERLSAELAQTLKDSAAVEEVPWKRLQTLCKDCHLKYRDNQ